MRYEKKTTNSSGLDVKTETLSAKPIKNRNLALFVSLPYQVLWDLRRVAQYASR